MAFRCNRNSYCFKFNYIIQFFVDITNKKVFHCCLVTALAQWKQYLIWVGFLCVFIFLEYLIFDNISLSSRHDNIPIINILIKIIFVSNYILTKYVLTCKMIQPIFINIMNRALSYNDNQKWPTVSSSLNKRIP